MRRLWVLALGAVVALALLPVTVASGAEDVDRFCEMSQYIGGPTSASAKDAREDHAFARRLARDFDRVARYASAEIASDLRALAAYNRKLGAAKSTKAAVAIANRRYDEISSREKRYADYVEQQCIESQLPPDTSPNGPYIEYSVGGVGRAAVTYLDATGSSVTSTVDLPWYVDLPVSPGQSVRISAAQQGTGIVHCQIYYSDGDRTRVIATDGQSGDHVVATCESTT